MNYKFWEFWNRVAGLSLPLFSHHRTCHLWHTAVSRREVGPGTNVPAASLLSLLARYPVNSSVPSRGFGLAPLPLPRFVTSPQLFFMSGIPHYRGSLRTFTAVRISRRSYKEDPPERPLGRSLEKHYQNLRS